MKGLKFRRPILHLVTIGMLVAFLYYLGRERIQLKHMGIFLTVIFVLYFALPPGHGSLIQ